MCFVQEGAPCGRAPFEGPGTPWAAHTKCRGRGGAARAVLSARRAHGRRVHCVASSARSRARGAGPGRRRGVRRVQNGGQPRELFQ